MLALERAPLRARRLCSRASAPPRFRSTSATHAATVFPVDRMVARSALAGPERSPFPAQRVAGAGQRSDQGQMLSPRTIAPSTCGSRAVRSEPGNGTCESPVNTSADSGATAGHHDHLDGRAPAYQHRRGFNAVHVRHHEIHQYDIGSRSPCHLNHGSLQAGCVIWPGAPHSDGWHRMCCDRPRREAGSLLRDGRDEEKDFLTREREHRSGQVKGLDDSQAAPSTRYEILGARDSSTTTALSNCRCVLSRTARPRHAAPPAT